MTRFEDWCSDMGVRAEDVKELWAWWLNYKGRKHAPEGTGGKKMTRFEGFCADAGVPAEKVLELAREHLDESEVLEPECTGEVRSTPGFVILTIIDGERAYVNKNHIIEVFKPSISMAKNLVAGANANANNVTVVELTGNRYLTVMESPETVIRLIEGGKKMIWELNQVDDMVAVMKDQLYGDQAAEEPLTEEEKTRRLTTALDLLHSYAFWKLTSSEYLRYLAREAKLNPTKRTVRRLVDYAKATTYEHDPHLADIIDDIEEYMEGGTS